jgi:hypothetical protein
MRSFFVFLALALAFSLPVCAGEVHDNVFVSITSTGTSVDVQAANCESCTVFTAITIIPVEPISAFTFDGIGLLEYDDATGSVTAQVNGFEFQSCARCSRIEDTDAGHRVVTQGTYSRRTNPDWQFLGFVPETMGWVVHDQGTISTWYNPYYPNKTMCDSKSRVCMDDGCDGISVGGGTWKCPGIAGMGGASATTTCFEDQYACFVCTAGIHLTATCKSHRCDSYESSNNPCSGKPSK